MYTATPTLWEVLSEPSSASLCAGTACNLLPKANLNSTSDDDGIPDSEDGDDDGDGVPDAEDNDDDNDGIPDSEDMEGRQSAESWLKFCKT